MADQDQTASDESLHSRTITWSDPAHAASIAAGLSGLDITRGLRDGLIPGPPLTQVMGMRCVVAEAGLFSLTVEYDPSLENMVGMFHGGVAASMLDTVMGCAAHSALPAGYGFVTLDMSVTYLRPITRANTPALASARVMNQGRRTIHVSGEIRGFDKRLVAHAIANFSVVGGGASGSEVRDDDRSRAPNHRGGSV